MAPVAAIYAHQVRHGLATFEEVVPTVAELRARRVTIAAAGMPDVVAGLGEEIVGYAYASAYRARPAYRYTVEDSLEVAENWHGRGVGRTLLETLINLCEAGPWRQMVAVIGNCGNAGSIALHRRCGFAPVGTFRSVGDMLGQWVDSVLMQRALGSGDAQAPE